MNCVDLLGFAQTRPWPPKPLHLARMACLAMERCMQTVHMMKKTHATKRCMQTVHVMSQSHAMFVASNHPEVVQINESTYINMLVPAMAKK
jgi:hypothetical protein